MCPNWWPPTAIKGGQAFEQAPHLMQVSASRISGSARIASRPLSRTTQCISRGPCAPMTGLKPMSEERRSEEHTSELQSREKLVCRLLLEKKNKKTDDHGYAVSIG